MSKLSEEYKLFLDDLNKNIKNKEDLEYIKQRLEQFINSTVEQIEANLEKKEAKIEKIENQNKLIEEKMTKMEEIIQNIERDIYSEDGFDFEIICPYCNYEFVIDVDEEKTEIKCPECQNIIELDWSGDPDKEQGCNGECSHCSGCGEEDNEDDM